MKTRRGTVLLTLASVAGIVVPGGLTARGANAQEVRVESALEELRASSELGLATEVLDRFAPLIEPGGALHREGEAIACVARAARDTGDAERAKRLLEGAQPRPGTEAYVACERARLAMESDRLEAALGFLLEGPDQDDKARIRFREHAEAWLLVARLEARRERYDRARPFCERYLALAPRGAGAPTAWHVLGQEAARRGDATRAGECLRAARELSAWHELLHARKLQRLRNPEAPLPRLGVALLWMEAEDFERARRELEALTARFPEYCRGWFHRGEAERASGRTQAAASAYGRALSCDPEHAPARLNRALLRMEADDPAGALADLDALAEGPAGADERFAVAHLLRARLLLARDEAAAAERSYARYKALGGREPLAEPGEDSR